MSLDVDIVNYRKDKRGKGMFMYGSGTWEVWTASVNVFSLHISCEVTITDQKTKQLRKLATCLRNGDNSSCLY